MNGYLKISEVAKRWGIKERRINALCLEGRIEGAVKFGNTWAIPEMQKNRKMRESVVGSILRIKKLKQNDDMCLC